MTGPTEDPDSATLLAELADALAFDPTPLRPNVHELHVPFDSMGAGPAESAAATTLYGTARLAVIGASGSGKTSFIWHVLNQEPAEGQLRLAPVRIPVGVEDTEVISSPKLFGQHLISTIADSIRRHDVRAKRARSRDRTVQRGGKVGLGAHVGLPDWALGGKVGAELLRVVEHEENPTGAQVLQLAGEIVNTMQDFGQFPVVVIDDSDQWLGRDRTDVVKTFFGQIVPELVREWPSGLVVAVHDHYLQTGGYETGSGFLDDLPLPHLPDAAAVGKIIGHRVQRLIPDGPAARTQAGERAVSEDATDALFDHYLESENIRRMLQRLHLALGIAVENGHDQVRVEHIDAAEPRM